MTWDVEKLLELFRNNDQEEGKRIAAQLPHIPRPRPGVSIAFIGIRRPQPAAGRSPGRPGRRAKVAPTGKGIRRRPIRGAQGRPIRDAQGRPARRRAQRKKHP